jgi:outer membrane lipoprotein-sorting protein
MMLFFEVLCDGVGAMKRAACCASALLILSHLLVTEASAQPSLALSVSEDTPSLYASFSRVFENSARQDSIAGEFYYIQPSRLYLEVDYPVHQVMVIDNVRNLTTIYYPDRKRAFQLQGEVPASLPIISGILSALQPDYGLSALGFEIYDQEIKGDTLLAYWRHPEDDGSLGEFTLARSDGRLLRAMLTLPETEGTATTRFLDFLTQGTRTIPVLIETETENFLGSASERLFFEDVQVNPDIPADVMEFRIPDGVTVEQKNW